MRGSRAANRFGNYRRVRGHDPTTPSSRVRAARLLVEPEKIKFCIEECETRIELALHYKIPYPRPMNLPPMGLAGKQGRHLKTQERLRKQAKPIYLQSHDET
uniref:LYR motif-containing protein 1 isoform X2 n=1 Tax=Petromyzon marinus TaxID=7757 RepID=A0AAJ7UHE7_PETMA|nr:LYR motif-containing protein 1 isoform X2 [Petromyzon marinus]